MSKIINMNIEVKYEKPRLAIYFLLGLVVLPITIVRSAEKLKSAREQVLQAVEDAKKGNMGQISLVIQVIGKGDKKYISEDLLSDYFSFLKDKNGKVQQLGAIGLCRIRTPKATKALFEYLKAKDLHKLDKSLEKGNVDFDQAAGEVYASVIAISALAVSGDKSAIPLLQSLQSIRCLDLEGSYPVEVALARLGAIDSLTNIPPNADKKKISRASSTIRKIRDPNKIPELIATARNPKIADPIRYSSIKALGEIGKDNSNSLGIGDFLVDIIGDSGYSRIYRMYAAIAAGKTKAPIAENPLLAHAQDPNSDIRQYALMGLVLYKPETYLNSFVERIIDPNENLEFRKSLTGVLNMYTQFEHGFLSDYRKQLYKCLSAADKDGKPINEIRVRMWELISDRYGDEPEIVLGSNSREAIVTLRSLIRHNLRRKRHRSIQERDKIVEEKLRNILTILPPDSEVEK